MTHQNFTKIYGDAAIQKAQMGTSLQRTETNVVLRLWGVLALLGVIGAIVVSGGQIPATWVMVLFQVLAGLVTWGTARLMKRRQLKKQVAEAAVIKEIDDAEYARKLEAFEAKTRLGADKDV